MRIPALAALALPLLVAVGGCGSSSPATTRDKPTAATAPRSGQPARPTSTAQAATGGNRALAVSVRGVGQLPSPTQDPATTALPGGGAVLFGGLDQADASVGAIVRIAGDRATSAGALPAVMHDMAATAIGAHAYAFGGGEGGASSAAILRDGTTKVASLPVAASDVTATTVKGTAYVVGGFDGSAPLDTIVAWRPGRPARVVAHLPRPLRYAAVAAVGGRVLIAGGTSGVTARREVLSFDPGTGTVKTIGRLPGPLTHAAGAALRGRLVLVGGRGDSLTSQTDRILAVDPVTGAAREAGRLPHRLSDAGAATLASRVLVAGGRDERGVVHGGVYSLSAR